MMLQSYDVDAAVRHLDSHALSLQSYREGIKNKTHTASCARYVREAILAGGIALRVIHSAKDYGPSLITSGFSEVSSSGPFQPGDVVVIQAFYRQSTTDGNVNHDHKHGHMAMFDGFHWVSDFIQTKHLAPGYPGKEYDIARPAFKVYRFTGGAICK